MWVITVLLVGGLLIALTAIIVDSPIGRSFARRFEGQGGGGGEPGSEVKQLHAKVEMLESEVADLQRSLEGMRDEVQFVQRLLENPARKKTPNP
jgi:hypothetical protein